MGLAVVDRAWIGLELPEFEVVITPEALQDFARTLGETNPVYLDADAARELGYRSIVAMPTYSIALGTRGDFTGGLLERLGVALSRVLHGSQRFVLHRPICGGDRLRGRKRVTDVYEKKGGALGFVETRLDYRSETEELVAEELCTLVIPP